MTGVVIIQTVQGFLCHQSSLAFQVLVTSVIETGAKSGLFAEKHKYSFLICKHRYKQKQTNKTQK
jgi:hypothetical protein